MNGIQIRRIPPENFSPALELTWAVFLQFDAADYAVAVYRKLGFRETDGEQEVNGIRFTPMLYGGNVI